MRDEGGVFTTGQVAKICNVASRTVSKWIDAGHLRGYRIVGSKDRRVLREELIAFLRRHGMPCDKLTQSGSGLKVIVVGTGYMAGLAGRLGTLVDEKVSVERCDTFFQAGLAFADRRIHILVVDAAAKGLQETVKSIRALGGSTVVLAVRVAGAVGEVKGIDAYLPSIEAPGLIAQQARQMLIDMGFKCDAM